MKNITRRTKILLKYLCLLSIFGSNINQDEDQFDEDLKEFLQEKYPETDLEELKYKIDGIETKNKKYCSEYKWQQNLKV